MTEDSHAFPTDRVPWLLWLVFIERLEHIGILCEREVLYAGIQVNDRPVSHPSLMDLAVERTAGLLINRICRSGQYPERFIHLPCR